MSLIATKDKKRMHRVMASGSLPRTDYYCPNIKCNAVLRLVDCDDAIKKDHFRVKPGYNHIDNCPYSDDSRFIVLNYFTDLEIKELEKILELCKINLRTLMNILSKFAPTINETNLVIYNAFSVWLNYDLTDLKDYRVVYNKMSKLSRYILKLSIKKFKLYTKGKEFIVGYCWPFKFMKISLSNLFFNLKSDTEKQGVIFHEAAHQALWLNDKGEYGSTAKNNKNIMVKRWNADNWSECVEEILRSWSQEVYD